MSETLVSVNTTDNSVTSCEPNDVKRPIQARCKLQPSSVVADDVSKNKSGSSDAMRYRKRRKTRRGKSKRRRLKPYSRSWPDRNEQDERESGKRVNNARAKLFASGQPVAPYNTTQFLMDDHNDLQNLDVKLQAVTTNNEGSNVPVLQRPSRARDSSLSVDSGEDYFYSSPEDEGDFLTKEFSNTYEDLHAERLNSMPKAQLIQEYLQMEAKVDMLEKRLKKGSGEARGHTSGCDKDGEEGEPMRSEDNKETDSSQKICSLKQEIDKLYMENEQLKRENDRLRCSYLKDQSVHSESSVDSESDSTPSCRCTDSETSCSCSSSSNSESVGCSSSDEETNFKSEPCQSETQLPDEPNQMQTPDDDTVADDHDKNAPSVRTCNDNNDEMM